MRNQLGIESRHNFWRLVCSTNKVDLFACFGWPLSYPFLPHLKAAESQQFNHWMDAKTEGLTGQNVRCSAQYSLRTWKETCWKVDWLFGYKDCKKLWQTKLKGANHSFIVFQPNRIEGGACRRCYEAMRKKVSTNGWKILAEIGKTCRTC
jgi:hypothetical protein